MDGRVAGVINAELLNGNIKWQQLKDTSGLWCTRNQKSV